MEMFNFDKKTELVIQSIAVFGAKTGMPVYFVGGMVRDCLMGIDIKDIDILIEGSAINFVQNFAIEYKNAFDIKIKSIHESFNTVKAIIDGIEIDFASTREEEYPFSGCLPVVTNIGCPIKDDLKRRDFTVNAIAARIFDENGALNYKIIDPFKGADDIKKKILTILHTKSYVDDPTRILRGLDFALRFGFDFADNDKILIEKYLQSPDRKGLSIDRVKLTLKKLFSETGRAKEAYTCILEKKYYKIWQDEAVFKKEWAQRLYEAVSIFNVSPSEIFLGAIFENSKAHKALSFNASNYDIYNFYKPFSNKDLALHYAILDDSTSVFYFEKLKDVKPDITGDDLIKQGYTQGKELGDELARRFQEKLNSIKIK